MKRNISTLTMKRRRSRHLHQLPVEQLEVRRLLSTLGQIGGAGTELLQAQVMDAAGNVYLAGVFTGAADFDPGVGTTPQMVPQGTNDEQFVAKYTPDGTLSWAKRFGGSRGDAGGLGLAVDALGNTYVSGVLNETADLGNGITLTAASRSSDAYVMKLDSSGATVWARAVSGTGTDRAFGVAVDEGSVYVTGDFRGQVDFDRSKSYSDNRDILKSAGTTSKTLSVDAFVWRLTTDGTFVSAWRIGGNSLDTGSAIVAANGVVYVHGSFKETADFDPSPAATANRTSANIQDLFVARYTPDAVGGLMLNWVQTIGGSNTIGSSRKIVADATHVYLPGSYFGTIDFDRNNGTSNAVNTVVDTLTNAGDGDVFVAKYNTADGSLAWVLGVGGPGGETGGSSLAVTDTGMVYIGGVFSQTIDFDSGHAYSDNRDVLTSKGSVDGFNLQVDMNGTYVNAWRMGGAGYDTSRVIGVYAGRLYSAGGFEQTADYPTGGTLTSRGATDLFLMSLNPPTDLSIGVPTGSALLAAATGPGAPTAGLLTSTALEPIVAEAKARWSALGADLAQVAGVRVAVANLSGAYLGLASGNTIILDRDAAGWGWFIDATPRNDSEFFRPGNQGEKNRMDLLTVVMHELGHLLQQDHDADGVMAETLGAGVRNTSLVNEDSQVVDAVFSQLNEPHANNFLSTVLDEHRWLHRPRLQRRR